jgi:predicted RNase H-like HicB family nuclease
MDMRKRLKIASIKRENKILKSRPFEKKRGIGFGVRSDVELSKFFKESGVPSLSKILKKVHKKQNATSCRLIGFNLPVIFFKEKGQFVAYTPALDISTSGKTLDEAERRFVEAAKIFLEECHAMGALSQVLQELGWEKKRGVWIPPIIGLTSVMLDV